MTEKKFGQTDLTFALRDHFSLFAGTKIHKANLPYFAL